jgi:CDGSH-type Zn-finger protein/uncharacterized Fe-S cluster protein YjdI
MLMLRLLAYAYALPRPLAEKNLAVDVSVGLMRAASLLAEAAARRPAGPSHPECHAGMSFTALRDAGAFPPGAAARRFFLERLAELSKAVTLLAGQGEREQRAAALLTALSARARRGFDQAAQVLQPYAAAQSAAQPAAAPVTQLVDGVEQVEGQHLQLSFEAKRCIHARFCVTGAPSVFLANVQGPWIHPDTIPVERLVEVAHACPSGAIRYRRKDAQPDESAPPVNLTTVRENGPYAVRADIRLEGRALGYRATLCRCGASQNKPFCDSSHHAAPFVASGEPATAGVDMLPTRAGPLEIEPEINGPLVVRGNLELLSGTGRAVARVTATRLCRCGGSANKPYCDGTHARIGFRSV